MISNEEFNRMLELENLKDQVKDLDNKVYELQKKLNESKKKLDYIVEISSQASYGDPDAYKDYPFEDFVDEIRKRIEECK